MTSFVSHTTIDCRNAYELSQWWKRVLEYVEEPGANDEPGAAVGDAQCRIERPDGGHPLLFIQVPEDKQIKNRIHLDLRPSAGTREEELARLLTLGAIQLGDQRKADGSGWVVLADPEGNEFCILRSLDEVDASGIP